MESSKHIQNHVVKVGVVIPTYKRPYSLRKCIQSVINSCDNEVDIVVINDGLDASVTDFLRIDFPNCVELTSTCDLWWTKSVNMGIKYLLDMGFTAAILLNDDVTVNHEYIRNIIVSHYRDPESIIISKVLDQDGLLWSLGGYTSWPLFGERHFDHSCLPTSNKDITWFPGMGTLIPLGVINKIGFLDEENMPQYLSDADFGLRATKNGINIILNEKCIVFNDTMVTGGIQKNKIVSPRDFLYVLFNLRSSDYLRARIVFTYRHAPYGMRTISFSIRIIRVIFYILKRLVVK